MKRRLALTVLVLLLTGWVLTVSEVPAATITGGNSTMEIDATTQAGISSWVVGGVDHIHQQWFWFRTSSTSPEVSLDTLGPPGGSFGPNDAVFRFTGSGLEFVLAYTLSDGPLGSGLSTLREVISFTNTTDSSINLTWFEYTDFDLTFGASDDTGTSTGVGTYTQTDAATTATIGASPAPAHFEISDFNVFPDIRTRLNDGSPTTLTDLASPLGPADVTQAFQWEFTIPALSSVTIEKTKSIDFTVPVGVPVPPTLILLGAALAVAAIASRSRRRP